MKEPRPQKRKRADLFETARSLATRWKKRLQSRRRKKDAKDERDKLARQSEWRAISRAYLESRGLKFIADVEGNDSFFLMSGQTEALKDIVKKPDPSVKPGKWLVLTDIAGDKPVPFEEANTRLADLAADGVVWVSTLRTRHSMHRKIPKNLDAPYALFSLKDVDQCVNLGAAGSAYLQHFRKKFSAEYSAEDTFFAAVTFLSMVIGFWFAIVIGVHTDWSGSLLRSSATIKLGWSRSA